MESEQEKMSEGSSSKAVSNHHEDIDVLSQATLKEISSVTKLSNEIPCDETFALYSSFPAFKRIMDMEGKKCTELIGKVFKKYNVGGAFFDRDLDEAFDMVVEANDQLLEKINSDLDEAAGIKRKLEAVVQTVSATADRELSGRWNVSTNRTLAAPGATTIRLTTATNIERPQLSFRRKVDNSPAPFEPIISDKPHALRPLAILLELDDEGRERFSHPYEFELERFAPADWALEPAAEPLLPAPAEQTPVTLVDTADGLRRLVAELGRCRELAVDLEHHSYRSYLGLTCLMQLSTRDRDYIVDPLQLRDQLQPLNEVFANPNIVKVFHGADSDVEWLQRDAGLYVVNMFDTHQASKVLALPRLSLAYLLQHFCNVTADKRLQLADWRIRPLPEDMIRYAQTDTHYLLYIYDRLRNLLLQKGNEQKNLLRSVYTSSTLICLKRYSKPILRPDSHLDLYRRSKKSFDSRQLAALKQLFKWRDELARLEDESTQYVLPSHMLLQMAELLPREMQGVLACCSPVPPLVRAHLAAVHQLVLAARRLHTGTEPRPQPAIAVQAPSRSCGAERSSDRHSPHDTSHLTDGDSANVPVLLSPAAAAGGGQSTAALPLCAGARAATKRRPQLDVRPAEAARPSAVGSTWISPYRRYLMMAAPVGDDKVARRMDELTEQTPTRRPPPTSHRPSPPPSPEAVLPQQGPEDVNKVTVEAEEEPEPPAPKNLRLSRKDLVREQKKAGTYRKAHKRKRGGGSAEGGAGGGPASQAGAPAVPAFDYSGVDYTKFGRREDAGRPASGQRGASAAGRKKKPWQTESGRRQTFGRGRR
ncbi:exosome component 10-like [Amphibalanus amphitrite]|uniref:exosome component 10-like n=1 Tax=Amphibalanus amphitrite TaxID=1232801 RepID=UPI001C8FEDC1|nr:exosome component 10-like [Amphibalanus amphitrite]XP_043202416.1 exosome component 10-like [Amphibalanus amphitrite]XP_043202417.1 exosome component 10-like [Amphibalanus amphitrite]